MMHKLRPKDSAGFTVLELMVATSVFAVVLLVLTAGVLSFSRSYFAGITRSNTQVVARSIINDIAHSIQFGQSPPTDPVTVDKTTSFCIDNVMYSYAIGQQVSESAGSDHQSKYGLVKSVSGCTAPADITSGGYSFAPADHELLGTHMRLSALSVTPNSNDTYTIRVRVAYGDDGLFGMSGGIDPPSWTTIQCQGGSGSQFCAVSDLTTTVQQRITR